MTEERRFEPGGVAYDAIAPNYAPSRAFSPETADVWAQVLEPFVRKEPQAVVLDLGCGTGRFAELFSERFGARVIGLDASIGMLRAGTTSCSAAASAEALPLPNASCDVAWLSQMIHHVADRRACARELKRVLRPDGCVLVRGTFGDRADGGCPTYCRYFPGARRIIAQVPTISEILAVFRTEGFYATGFQSVTQKTCGSLKELAARTRLRADTTLVLMSDDEFALCQADIERAAEAETVPQPVYETIDMLVFRPHSTAS